MKKYPLSEYQKGFWLDWRLNPNSSKYNTPLIYKLKGELNRGALHKALSIFMNKYLDGGRHYCCESKDGLVEIVVLESIKVDLEYEETKSIKSVEAFIEECCGYYFDLKRPPLFKFNLLKIKANEHVLILNFHHIITDAFTAHFIIKTVSQLYNHYAFGKALPEQDSRVFENFLSAQENFYSSSQKAEDAIFWNEKLFNKELSIKFPFKINTRRNNNGYSRWFSLNEQVTKDLKSLARRERCTPFVVLSALYVHLLYRYTKQENIALFYPVNLRNKEYKELPGCFINNLPMIVKIDKNMTFKALLQVLIQERKKVKPHQKYPLTDMVQMVKHAKSINIEEENLFNVGIAETFLYFLPLTFYGIETACLQLKKREIFSDLCLCYELGDTLTFRLDYKEDLFSTECIEGFARHFEILLKQCLLDTEKAIHEYVFLTESEQKKITIAWNETNKNFAQDKLLHHLFEEQVLKTPNNTALIFEKYNLSYELLNQKANQLAHYLIKTQREIENNNKKRNIIAVFMDRKPELVISILAILKIGAAYLPLDPEESIYRLNTILQDSAIGCLLTLKVNLKKQPLLNKIKQVVQLDSDWHKIEKFPKINLLLSTSAVDSFRLAYIIYTSGSTGKPKGVMIEHKSVLNLIMDIKRKLEASERESIKSTIILSLTSPQFDIYGLELFLPLLYGGTHILCLKETTRDPVKINALIEKHAPTLIQATPTFWAMAFPYLKKTRKPYIIFSGGEPLQAELAYKLKSLANSVWNLYGPTETTIWSTFYRLEEGDNSALLIGQALANTRVYVLDEYLNLVPPEVIGELYISGMGLALGYLNDEKLNQESFINNPFTKEPPYQRLYKTGDLVSWTPNGLLEYRGRKDSQFKIRGHRIDVSEIESILNSHPKITNSVIHVVETPQGINLIAYYVLKQNKNLIQNLLNFQKDSKMMNVHLHKYLQKRLPNYMLPVAYVKLSEIPVNINGKVDKSRLPTLNLEHYLSHETSLHVSDVIELKLKEIWLSLLNITDIKIQDSFFDLGGNSFLAISLINKINEVFKKQYSVAWLFENKTIFLQAKTLRTDKAEAAYQCMVNFNAKNLEKPDLFLVHPGLAGAEVYDELSRLLEGEVNCYAFDSYNLNSGYPFLRSIEALAEEYIKHLKQFKPKGPYQLGGWSLGGIIAYEMAQQLTSMGDSVAKIYLLDSQLYSSKYLDYLHSVINVKGLIAELPENRGLYISNLPKHYLDKVLASLKNDIQLFKDYVIKPYLGPVLLVKSLDTTKLNIGLLSQKHNGFKPLVNKLQIETVSANHYNLMEGEQVKDVAEVLRNFIFI